jgi:hypothetical protein
MAPKKTKNSQYGGNLTSKTVRLAWNYAWNRV